MKKLLYYLPALLRFSYTNEQLARELAEWTDQFIPRVMKVGRGETGDTGQAGIARETIGQDAASRVDANCLMRGKR